MFTQSVYYHLQDRNLKANAKGEGSESLSNKVRDLEAKLSGNRCADKKPKDLIRAIGTHFEHFQTPLFF